MHFAYRVNDSLSEAKNIDSNIDSTIDMRISIFISLSFRYIPIMDRLDTSTCVYSKLQVGHGITLMIYGWSIMQSSKPINECDTLL